MHGYDDDELAVRAVAENALREIVGGRSVLVMAPTTAVVTELNEVMTWRLVEMGVLQADKTCRIGKGGPEFFEGQTIVTRMNKRWLRVGDDGWVRNGDRWTVVSGNRKGLVVANQAGETVRLPAWYVREAVEIGYASTIHRAQGATVDVAHVLVSEGTDANAFYVAMTRGRFENHVHVARPARDQAHGLEQGVAAWEPMETLTGILERHEDSGSALAWIRKVRERAATPEEQARKLDAALSTIALETGSPWGAPSPAEVAQAPRTPYRVALDEINTNRPDRGAELRDVAVERQRVAGEIGTLEHQLRQLLAVTPKRRDRQAHEDRINGVHRELQPLQKRYAGLREREDELTAQRDARAQALKGIEHLKPKTPRQAAEHAVDRALSR